MTEKSPRVGIIMGSQSDWDTMKEASDILEELGVAHECKIISAHRTPDRMADYAKGARDRGLQRGRARREDASLRRAAERAAAALGGRERRP